jgi:hypothetical protein
MAAITGAVIGLGTTAVTTGMSFAQAAKQNQLMKEAQAKADQAMQEARKKLEVNYYDQLAIKKEPYELQREAMLSSGAQALEGAREADRGAAATAGRLQAMQNQAQAGIRTEMGKELMDLERLSATEESRLRDVNVQLDMGEAMGAQMAAKDAQEARTAAMAQGFQGIAGMAGYAAEMVPLYMQTAASKQFGAQQAEFSKRAAAGQLGAEFMIDGKPMTYQQAIQKKFGLDVGGMKQADFESYMTGKGKKFINQYDLFGSTPISQPQTPQQRQEAEMFMRGTLGPGNINPFAPYNTGFNPYLQQQQSGFDMLGGYSPSNETFPMLDRF